MMHTVLLGASQKPGTSVGAGSAVMLPKNVIVERVWILMLFAMGESIRVDVTQQGKGNGKVS